MKIHSAVLPAALAVLFTAIAPAQGGKPTPAKPFVLEAGETSIADLIDRCAAYLDCNILATPGECGMAAPVRLQRAITTDHNGCQELLANMLSRSGLVLTVLDEKLSMFEVILANGQRGREIMQRAQQRTPEQVLMRPRLKVPVVTAVQLKHIHATMATNALRPFFASQGSNNGTGLTIGNVGSPRNILLAGMQDQVAQALRLILSCDVEQPAEPYHGQQPLPQYVAKLAERIKKLEKKVAAMTKAKSQTR